MMRKADKRQSLGSLLSSSLILEFEEWMTIQLEEFPRSKEKVALDYDERENETRRGNFKAKTTTRFLIRQREMSDEKDDDQGISSIIFEKDIKFTPEC